MPDMTYEDLEDLARRRQGERLERLRAERWPQGCRALPPAIQRDRQHASGRLRRRHQERLVLHRPPAPMTAPREDGKLTVALISEVYWEADGPQRLKERLAEASDRGADLAV